MKQKRILVTGAAGMIGSATVDALLSEGFEVIGLDRIEFHVDSDRYTHIVADLGDFSGLLSAIRGHSVDRVIHLAALAHTVRGESYTPEQYSYFNIECADNVFRAAGDIPVLFVSTVDVYGFTKEIVDGDSPVRPVSPYAVSKAQAEEKCKKLDHYSIYRFSPVYTDSIKRDIQKRYYLKSPKIAYRIGKGTEYEILNIRHATAAIVKWCSSEVCNEVRVIKDPQRMHTAEYIRSEKAAGRANFVIYVPSWVAKCGYYVLKAVLGERSLTYLLHKAVYPLRSR